MSAASATSGTRDHGVSTVKAREEAAKAASKEGMNSVDFMKLLIAQLTNQDPLSPMENMDFTSQIAQLQALEEQTSMTQAMKDMRLETQMQTGAAMIGREVTGVDTTGKEATGIVVNVLMKDSKALVELEDGTQIEVAKVTRMNNVDNDFGNQLGSAANAVGMFIEAGSGSDAVRGIVSNVVVEDGKILLQLYGGKKIALEDIRSMRIPTDDDAWYTLPDEVREKIEFAGTMLREKVTGKNDAGEEITGIMIDADRVGSDVYLVLESGERIKLENVQTHEKATAGDAEKYLTGKYAVGLDEKGNRIEGVITGAETTESGMALTLEDGSKLYYDFVAGIFDEKPAGES